jgi:hypothetical protein
MLTLDNLYILVEKDYNYLLVRKKEIQALYDAKAAIVTTTNMNPHVLMQDIVHKKRLLIAQIDSTKTGQDFLRTEIVERPEDEVTKLISRLRVGHRIRQHRKTFNKEFVNVQRNLTNYNLTVQEKHSTYIRHLVKKLTELKELRTHYAEDAESNLASEVVFKEIKHLMREIQSANLQS